MRAVNLLPKDVQRASAQKPWGPVLIGVLLVVACAGVLFKMHSSATQQMADARTQIAAITHKPVKKPPNVTDGQRQAAAQEGPRITALDSALQHRIPWDNVLRQVSLVVPDNVHLTKLSLKAPTAADSTTPPAPTAPPGVTIDGYSYSQDGVAQFLARLQVVPALVDVALGSSVFSGTSTVTTTTSTTTGSTPTGVVTFEITASVVEPAVVS